MSIEANRLHGNVPLASLIDAEIPAGITALPFDTANNDYD
jgi:hypothetical protein